MRNREFKRIETDYDSENDTHRDGPDVTWAEMALYDAVRALASRVAALEARVIVVPKETSEESNGMGAAAQGVELAQSLGLDDAVRTVAKTGRNHDRGPNWYYESGNLTISATFGAGTNSATVRIVSDDIATNHLLLYHADGYGRRVDVFRNGPWVKRILTHANELRRANEVKAQEDARKAASRRLDNFREVNF